MRARVLVLADHTKRPSFLKPPRPRKRSNTDGQYTRTGVFCTTMCGQRDLAPAAVAFRLRASPSETASHLFPRSGDFDGDGERDTRLCCCGGHSRSLSSPAVSALWT
ncbi:hypothetical protein HPB50_003883 [Hyalomma asiaticum]|uniref:Uncharacterized protein n=1 Tax=Hyalomma asiaticum TaxID=266040 RepID=A0ACB7RWS7_HYAAI|nr:hypothetical protein HPB50_003883 [Hyalomma asiaticum]